MTNIKKYTEYPSEGVTARVSVEIYDGEACDTTIDLKGRFVVSGQDRREFLRKLSELIDQYRI